MVLQRTTLIPGIVFLSLLLPATTHARFKCWTNSDGVRECGETVPPEYAQQGHEEINKLGITVDTQERAKTEEEIAEEKRLAEEQAEQERAKLIKEREDRILRETFSSVEDINMTRDGKIASLESAISLSNKRIEKLQGELDLLITRAAMQEKKGKAPSEQLVEDIDSLKRQIENNENFIVERKKDQELIREEYADYVVRFEALRQ